MAWWRVLAALCLGLSVLGPLLSGDARADSLEDETRRIAKQLRCPICESVSVAESPSELATQMRGVIRRKLEAGESEQQILDYFVAAYGDSVLLEPPRRGLGLAVWLGPLAAVAIGAVVLWVLLRGWVRTGERRNAVPPAPAEAGPSSDAEHEARARRELEAVRKGLAG